MDIKFSALENIAVYNPETIFGRYDIPVIRGAKTVSDLEWVGFNYARSMKGTHKDKGVIFYLDDYQFSAVWNSPERYVPVLKRFGAVLAPDFSMFTDMPLALQIYNHYRRMWCAAYWQQCGINVIPCICWSDERSFKFCFDGQPFQSIVSISTVGTQNNADSKELFREGYERMMCELKPSKVLVYGKVLDFMGDEAVRIGCFTDKFRKG